MSMFGKYPPVVVEGKLVEQNGLNGAPKAWPTTDCSKDPVIASQSQKDAVDINKIVSKMEKGLAVSVLQREGSFDDVSMFDGLDHAIMVVNEANERFMQLPADMREKFENNPVKLVEFLEDGKNRDEAVKLGLVNPKDRKSVV